MTLRDERLIREAIDHRHPSMSAYANRGTSMPPKKVSQLPIAFSAARSRSHLRVSDNKPYSNGQLRTTKSAAVYLECLDPLAHARGWC